MDLSYYQSYAKEMYQNDTGLMAKYQAMHDMFHSQWELPSSLQGIQWVHKVVTTDPADAISAGTRVLSSIFPRVYYCPNLENEATKAEMNKRERFAKYWLEKASDRQPADIVDDVVMSALLYMTVIARVDLLDYQIKIAKQEGLGNAKRLEMARQYGPFIVSVKDPRAVHVRHTGYGPEAVYTVTTDTVAGATEFWGGKGAAIKAHFAKTSDPADLLRTVYVHDLSLLDRRAIWVSENPTADTGGVALYNADPGLPFFPWVVRVGGTNLEDKPEYRSRPILSSVYEADQWEAANIAETLLMSDAIARMAKPKGKKIGPNPDSIEKDYEDPGGDVIVPSGHDYQPLQESPYDQGFLMLADRRKSEIGKSTVSRVLMDAQTPSNTAFGTLNLTTLTALGALKPHKRLSERGIADIFTLMFRWVAHNGQNMTMIDERRDVAEYGKEYILEAATIDAENINIKTELTPDIPTDRHQRINAAAMAVRELNYSRESALEDIGVEDPKREMRRSMFEQLQQNEFAIRLQERQVQSQLALQQQQYEQQMAMQQQQMQPTPETGVGGMGFDPNQGGVPPAMMVPEATREGQTGQTRTGDEVAYG